MTTFDQRIEELMATFHTKRILAMTYFEDGAPGRAGELLREAADAATAIAAEKERYVRGIAE